MCNKLCDCVTNWSTTLESTVTHFVIHVLLLRLENERVQALMVPMRSLISGPGSLLCDKLFQVSAAVGDSEWMPYGNKEVQAWGGE